MKSLIFLSILTLCSFATIGQQVPGTLSYQGILLQDDGITPLDGAHSIEFNFYTVSTGGTPDGSLTRTVSVTANKGLFTCIIGDGSANNAALPSSVGQLEMYIGIKVDGGAELTPRARLTPVAYAFQAQSAYTISDNAVTSGKIADGTITTADVSNVAAAKISGIATGMLPKGDGTGLIASQIFDNGTRIGIGTTDPDAVLDISGDGSQRRNVQLTQNTAGVSWSLNNFETAASEGAGNFGINQVGVGNRLLINTSGNIGIGTSTPTAKVDVVGSIKVSDDGAIGDDLSVGGILHAGGITADGSVSTGGHLRATDYIFCGTERMPDAAITGNSGVDLQTPIIQLDQHYGVYGTSASGTYANFGLYGSAVGTNINCGIYATAGGGTTDWAGFFSGNVKVTELLGIGRDPTTNDLEVNGTASKSTAGDWLANSDRRIKTDISDIDNSIETIKRLRPVRFRYTSEWRSRNPDIKDRYYYNFIAQEYQQVFPESVQGSGEYLEGDPDEILQIDTYNAQIVSIKAIQELISQVEALKATNRKLEQRLQAMEAQFSHQTASSLPVSGG